MALWATKGREGTQKDGHESNFNFPSGGPAADLLRTSRTKSVQQVPHSYLATRRAGSSRNRH